MLTLSREPNLVAEAAIPAADLGVDQKAETMIAEVRRGRPDDTFVQNVLLPSAEARLQLRHGKPAAAVQTLAAAEPYDDGRYFNTHILRGEAYLASGSGPDAAAEFRKFLARRALWPLAFEYPLAQLGLARALASQHETAGARTEYQNFFAMWKDADPDIPVLKDARAEYAKLQ